MFKIYDGRSHFYQWDIDRKLIVEDASISEVHFCNQTDNYSLVCKTYIEDGLNLVNVPNILLQNDWRINVYAYDSNYTKFSEQFDVIRRCKPEDYVYTETEILNYNTLSDRITKIEEGGGITPTIGDNGNWYLGSTDTGKPSRGEKGETGARGEKGDTGAQGPQGEKGETGARGEKGADGATGADGKSAYSYAQDGGYTGTEAEFAAKLAAEKLPNPYPLTFTGAVSETYDGSSAKTIEIPSGGGTSEKEWWLLRTISITESVSSVSISQDDNGDAFAIEDIFMYAPKSVTTSNSSQLIVWFNGDEGKSTSLNDFFNTNQKSFIYESYWSGRRVFRMGSSTYDFQSVAGSTIAMRVALAPKKINKIDLSLQSGQTFTAGTIYIYAR